ncbi:hypothetical protein [Rickettsia endosymbiont of Urophora cardui]|uniref:hypothetical protein n=1 Tax=Rickettsia endosymbiont of Urophora cardui TaxID=3066265 RepID=UPI00313E8E2E
MPIIIKISNENIDENKNNQIKPQTFSQTLHSQHLESELCSLSSKSLKNSNDAPRSSAARSIIISG